LGAHVLRQLIELDTAMIYCIVRAPNTADARKRIERSMANIGAAWLPTYSARIKVLCGDLMLPQWGLDHDSWHMLTHHVASIFHCAATVNMVQSYDELCGANVGATQSVVEFACTARRKTLHYASTLSVFVAADKAPALCYEDAPFDTGTWIHGGYAQSKWVADDFLQQCAAKGLPVSIYRFGLITGDSQSGRCATHDYLAMFVRGLMRLGELPAGDWESLELDVTPVDYAARAMVHIAQGSQGGCFHLAGASRFSLRMIHDVLAEYGHTLLVCDPNTWHPSITDHSEGAAAYMALCRLLKNDHTFTRFRSMDLFQATHQQFDQTNTHAALAGTNITCPPATNALLKLYLDRIFEGITL
jgi:thioester reductase-like protein